MRNIIFVLLKLSHFRVFRWNLKAIKNRDRCQRIWHACFLFLIMNMFFSGCEKVIDIDLNEANPALVIEGNLSYEDNRLLVKISETGSYFDESPMKKVTGADVYLDLPDEKSMRAFEDEPGVYRLSNVPLSFEAGYVLRVKAAGVTCSAKSTLNKMIEIDSLTYKYYKEKELFDNGYRINIYFNDPVENRNYYRIRVYKNGTLKNGIDDLIVFDDSGIDGKYVQVRLSGQVFSKGDTAKIELVSIDEGVWKYFTTLSEVADLHPGSPAPANPVSNFNNGVLGYFSAWSNSYGTIIIDK
ncbi:MAG: DUF4249 domain-containing protein [Prolixibacteraceae bacterium]|nr:DUF4249 domain-containing protein [Prolixibacteraceae bacterium]